MSAGTLATEQQVDSCGSEQKMWEVWTGVADGDRE
jgi:hypothetical protein